MADLVPFGRTDWVAISATQRKSRGSTEITLHVCNGFLFELEIWTGGFGVRPRVDVTKLEHFDWAADDEIE